MLMVQHNSCPERITMKNHVSVAVIGSGYWGRKFVGEYLAAEQKGKLKLLKVCDQSIAALGATLVSRETAKIGEERLTQNLSDVLDDQEITAVHIATPSPTHYEIARKALEAGKHVLVEKPMTLKPSESHELVELARSRGLVIQVGHIYRFNAALRLAREIVDRGELGKLFYIRIQWTDQAFFPDRDIIFDLGPHPIDILNQLLGTWPGQLTGMTRGFRGDQGEVAYIIAEFPNDVFAHVELSWLHPNKIREVTIVGSAQTLVVDCLKQSVFRSRDDTREQLAVSVSNTMQSEIDCFVDSMVRGDSPSESGPIGARTVEVLDAIRSSIWDRPLPVIQREDHATMNAVIGVPRIANQRRTMSDQNDSQTKT
jgi:UDP-N-acetylglucosamine 3-dehydrogenase